MTKGKPLRKVIVLPWGKPPRPPGLASLGPSYASIPPNDRSYLYGWGGNRVFLGGNPPDPPDLASLGPSYASIPPNDRSYLYGWGGNRVSWEKQTPLVSLRSGLRMLPYLRNDRSHLYGWGRNRVFLGGNPTDPPCLASLGPNLLMEIGNIGLCIKPLRICASAPGIDDARTSASRYMTRKYHP
jgi:hypothetical protein